MSVIKSALRGAHIGRKLAILRHEAGAGDAAALAAANAAAAAAVGASRQVRVIDRSINAHEGGVAVVEPFGTLPPNSIVFGVITVVDVSFDGTTGTIQLDGYTEVDAKAAPGTVVTQAAFGYADTHAPLNITWTNDGGTPTVGVVRVILVYA